VAVLGVSLSNLGSPVSLGEAPLGPGWRSARKLCGGSEPAPRRPAHRDRPPRNSHRWTAG